MIAAETTDLYLKGVAQVLWYWSDGMKISQQQAKLKANNFCRGQVSDSSLQITGWLF